ncbi:SDR family oxidoreductase [Sphingobium yanoikuyae]|jgi:3-oxoacyl-[acyl-carrier protein] reductase|uniref:SDR family NAD(P)-dependent oxidoreductase n=1 Tax=Sphingobium yanoikuyae TaxID=13690 RepID=A0A430BNB5_SPHYA|nr:SDR family oxidoreductase [Sphingobium yanoikuyae]RSU54197.1 SDR family NAD(P)-dependent oxidoreductase [Sphingobium yanoikuyae]
MIKSVAIVTGASSGIGRATALRLARDFSALTLVARRSDRLEAVAEEVRIAGAEVRVVAADLSLSETAGAVVATTLEKFGRIDAVLNIAGAVPGIDLFALTEEQWAAGFELKLHGARRLALAAWPALRKSYGSLVFTSGTGAVIPTAATAAIGTINAAVEVLAKAFADQGIADGVQVNSVSPGLVMTDRRRGLISKWAQSMGIEFEEAEAELKARAGIARYGRPEEIADLFAFTVSPIARWMTGMVLRMDGGEVKAV